MMAPEEIAAVVRRAAAGDSEAWETIVQEYANLLRSVVRDFRLGPAETSDALQTIWLRLIEKLHTIRDPACLPAWLITTAQRVCLETIRARSRYSRAVQESGILVNGGVRGCCDVSARDEGPEVMAVKADQGRALQVALATLSQRDQILMRLLVEDDRPNYREISRKLGMPIGSIGPTRARILARLRIALEEAGVRDAAST
jgi:RNA polymerase sigma factor (sigma-70 family)